MNDESRAITKSNLVERISKKVANFGLRDSELSVNIILDEIINSLSESNRTEIRGFGSFSVHYRKPRIGRNPKTGEPVSLPGKNKSHFKPGKSLKSRINNHSDNNL